MTEERDELLARIAALYYYQDMSQQEIAEQVGISRSNISRLLKEARERGIVEIFVHHPIGRDMELERQLKEQFGLRAAAVVQAAPGDALTTLHRAAQLAAMLLDEHLAGASVLAISWGTTVHAIVDAFTPRRRHDVEVVQLMGGISSSEPVIDGPALVQRLARTLTGRYRYLHAPLVVDRPEVAEALKEQRNIAEALEVAAKAEVALVGIGALDSAMSSLLRAGYLTGEEFAEIAARGAVGDICARHFDQDGRPMAPEIDARLLSVDLAMLARIPTVIGVACSASKARAIRGALAGGYVDVLVTDSAAAEAVLLLDAARRREGLVSS